MPQVYIIPLMVILVCYGSILFSISLKSRSMGKRMILSFYFQCSLMDN
jgi:hypothetical protein